MDNREDLQTDSRRRVIKGVKNPSGVSLIRVYKAILTYYVHDITTLTNSLVIETLQLFIPNPHKQILNPQKPYD